MIFLKHRQFRAWDTKCIHLELLPVALKVMLRHVDNFPSPYIGLPLYYTDLGVSNFSERKLSA